MEWGVCCTAKAPLAQLLAFVAWHRDAGASDVDEYLYCERKISDVLDEWDDDDPFLRVPPAEALHDPSLPDDIFTAQQFRLPFPNRMSDPKRAEVLGEYLPILRRNMLSHNAGKSFFKTGIAGLIPKIHAGSFGKNEPPLSIPFFEDATPEQINAFYDATQTAQPDLVAALAQHGLLVEADLKLKDKVSDLPF